MQNICKTTSYTTVKISFILYIILIFSNFNLTTQEVANLSFRDTTLTVEERVEHLLNILTLDEKLSMLDHTNPAIERLGIEEYNWWNEALHGLARKGKATSFPQAIGLAATFDDKAVEECFSMIADEARAKFNIYRKEGNYDIGLSFYTPNINIFRDPRWGRGMETYGEDPFLTSKMGIACVSGLQSNDDGSKHLKALACAKHFAVHSGPEGIRHSFDVSVSNFDLRTTYLKAFYALIKEADVQQVMCAYNRYDGEPCCTNEFLLKDILRDEWGYKNIVVTDCWALNDCWEPDTVIIRHRTHSSAKSAASDAFSLSVDIECGSSSNVIKDTIIDRKLAENQADIHLQRLLTAQMKLGLYDPILPYANYDESILECDKHVEKSLEMAEKSIVLLRNSGILPIKKKYKIIPVIGPNAHDSIMLLSNYHGTPSRTTTVLEGIYHHFGGSGDLTFTTNDTLLHTPDGISLYYNEGCDIDGELPLSDDFYNYIEQSRIVIFVGGLSPEVEGEQLNIETEMFDAGDRKKIELPKSQKDMLQYLRMSGKAVIFVLCTGSAIALEEIKPFTDAILCSWYGGQEGGTAVANVLFGEYNPSGRLPVTFYKSTDQLPDFADYDMKGRTYRFMKEEPSYHFGFGLSYTDFEYKRAKYNPKDNSVECLVKNIGELDGDEVVQVYIKRENDRHGIVKELAGFKRVHIKAGKTEKIVIPLSDDIFLEFDDTLDTFVESNDKLQIYCGSSSRNADLIPCK